MDEEFAREIALARHAGQLDRAGGQVVDHLRRVVARVPASTRSVAWLHDLLERAAMRPAELRFCGLSAVEAAALNLLTRGHTEPYDAYVMPIARGRGAAGALARRVKLADLEDHLAAPQLADRSSPPYAWARRLLEAGGHDAVRGDGASSAGGLRVCGATDRATRRRR
jgi:hypothetical protein